MVLVLLTLGCGGLTVVGDDVVKGEAPTSPDSGDLPPDAVQDDLTGRLYSIAPANMLITEPSGLDSLRTTLFNKNILIDVMDQAGDRMLMGMALAGDDGQQNHCEVVRPLPAADWSQNPSFYAGPGDVDLSFGGSPATLYDMRLSGTFSPDGRSWSEGQMQGSLDTRQLPNLGTDACTLVASFEGSCVPCDDGEPYCFALSVEQIGATWMEGAAFDPRETGDCQ